MPRHSFAARGLGVALLFLAWSAEAAPRDVDGDGIVGPMEAIDLSANWKEPALPSGGVQPWQIDGATIFYNTGKVGIGSATPHHQLRISGGPTWTSNLWSGAVELDSGAAIGWRANDAGKRFGIGHSGGGLYFFNTSSDLGTATGEAQYAMSVADDGAVHVPGSVGIGGGVTDQGARFQVNDGRIRIRETATLERWDLFYDPPTEKFYLQENAAYNHLVFTKGPESRLGVGTNSPLARFHVSVPTGSAVLGESPGGNGVVGTSAATGFGATAGTHSGTDGIGVYGEANTGLSSYGVFGRSNQGTAVYGISTIGEGVSGVSTDRAGVHGTSSSGSGVEGQSSSASGVRGVSGSGAGLLGRSADSYGVYGYSEDSIGVFGTTDGSEAGDAGVVAHSGSPDKSPALRVEGYATFTSTVRIKEALFADSDIFLEGSLFERKRLIVMDHPLDPSNQYLSHTAVESPQMLNVYSGNITTDTAGCAGVVLPDYFEALNTDFRYQLTVIGDFARAVISKEIMNNTFEIRTDKPNVKVSWQVTGIRNDPYAKANPLEVETMKTPEERGKYLNPDLYGQPKEKGIYFTPADRSPSSHKTVLETR